MIVSIFEPQYSNKVFSVNIVNSFKFQYAQKVDYIKVANGKTRAYNYGALADKWYSEITIIKDKESMELISQILSNDILEMTITLNEAEQIFGAGIDYTLPIACNITSPVRQFTQEDMAFSSIKLNLYALQYTNETQLKYKDSIPTGLPQKLNFQLPIDRDIIKQESTFQSENFGIGGRIVELSASNKCSISQQISIVFDQTEEEQAQIEKFVSTQRSTPFIFSEADYVYLFKDQDVENVMLNGMISTRVSHNYWRTTLKMVTNV